ncbi:MAG: ATP-binding protein [Planctomycetota bacterium]|nr:ATP-binding protein [Planctomycetota bacterium]
MWSSRLFWKPFGYFSLLIILSSMLGGGITIQWQNEQLQFQVQQRLAHTMISLESTCRQALTTDNYDSLQKDLEALHERTTTRITLIDDQGVVQADSHRDAEEMENLKNQPELVSALRTGSGSSVRFSNALEMDMLFVAQRIEHEGQTLGCIRAALDQREISNPISQIQFQIASLVLTIIIIGLVIGAVGISRMTRPVIQLIEEARELTSGQIKQPRNLSHGNEFDELGQTLNNLSRTLSKRMKQLERNHNELLIVLEGMKEGVIAVDGDERIRFANEAVCRMFELDLERDQGRPIWEVLRNQMIETTIKKARKSDEPFHGKIELQSPHEQHLSLSASAIPGKNQSGVIIVFHDVTEIYRLENMRRNFVANVSHELKTPLASIQAYAETLLDGAIHDSDNNTLFLTQIMEQSDRLNLLIQDLLSIARLESGDSIMDFASVNVTEISQRCLDNHQTRASKKNITLSSTQPNPVWVFAEADGLRQILDNLVDNALKYTPNGGQVTVDIQAESAAVLLKVVDTGIGISEEHKARIFERFYRVDKARSRELGGTGLGLAIVKHLVSAFGGDVQVFSEPDQGTTFQIEFPIPTDSASAS